MSNIDKRALREELSNPAIGSNANLRKLALALLDELEAADALNKHLELAIRKAEGCSEALRRKTEAAEKRVAELEAREVKFSLRPELTAEDCDILARSIDYGTGWNLALSLCEEEFIRALTAAGIRINGED